MPKKRFLKKKYILILVIAVIAFAVVLVSRTTGVFNYGREIGTVTDSLNGVFVYYNGNVGNVSGRNLAPDGYNLGLKYQCVEFVKRYYYEYLNHKMPDSYGHAKDFFDKNIGDGEISPRRNLIQYTNGSRSKPEPDDLIIMDGTVYNKYGHVAIISHVFDNKIEIIQQNPGANASSRAEMPLILQDDKWRVYNERVLGWLRKK